MPFLAPSQGDKKRKRRATEGLLKCLMRDLGFSRRDFNINRLNCKNQWVKVFFSFSVSQLGTSVESSVPPLSCILLKVHQLNFQKLKYFLTERCFRKLFFRTLLCQLQLTDFGSSFHYLQNLMNCFTRKYLKPENTPFLTSTRFMLPNVNFFKSTAWLSTLRSLCN